MKDHDHINEPEDDDVLVVVVIKMAVVLMVSMIHTQVTNPKP